MTQQSSNEGAMPFHKGQSGNPSGKKKGTGLKIKAQAQEVLVLTGEQPGHFLARLMSDPNTPKETQVECAKALMPYLHKKKPEAREIYTPGEEPNSAATVERIRRLLGA
jgi:Family of unknown function (DUF5681)